MGRRCLALLLFFSALVACTLAPRAARADQPGPHTVPVVVLALDSDDAEEQAEALTVALRSRIRSAPGWSLVDTTQSLGMLTAALKCPARPTTDCQQRIADQLKTDRYIWGFVTKSGAGRVTAEVHLYQRGASETPLRESYSENLKDGNDDTLGKIAASLVDRLGGAALGVVVVRADRDGEVVIDGDKRVTLQNGAARIEVAAGGHAIELAAEGIPVSKRNVVVTAGEETVVNFADAAGSGAAQERSFPTRKVIGGTTMLVGAGLAALGVVGLVNYLDARSDGEAYAKGIAPPPGSEGQPCREYDRSGATSCLGFHNKAVESSTMAIVAGSASVVALGVGAFLFFGASDSSASEKSAATKPKARVIPTASPAGGGLTIIGAF